MLVVIPVDLIIRSVTCCIDACYQKAAERRARREAERLIAEEQERHVATASNVAVVGSNIPKVQAQHLQCLHRLELKSRRVTSVSVSVWHTIILALKVNYRSLFKLTNTTSFNLICIIMNTEAYKVS